ncbi:hypothetical protein [Dyadobacter sandarakinus]|uniref:DUF4468 domain-containing protein n=1 Tax=Dyadobacter sandarakinus TaxID=2747268 RepID=A0ABX7I5N4_9BACT|nr:hypothetical protein [Dyadobacter sandarakinus]QRR00321.1 hypothetical protein HWI92_05070 [Dyadobacter sandarakinus]
MEEKNYAGLIPDEREGWAITAVSRQTEPDEAAARSLFELAEQRLRDVNQWGSLLKSKMADFQLTDTSGNDVSGSVSEGQYFKIDILGPGTTSGQGYDWVRVEAVARFEENAIEHVAMRVRPASNPSNNNTETAHFYSDKATSTFTITREGTTVTASIYDRNTDVNKDGETLLEKARNLIVGAFGKLVLSKIQWQDLTDGLIRR